MPYKYNPFTGKLDRTGDDSGFADSFVTDSGTATPVGGIINLLGVSAQGSTTSGAGNTVTITNTSATDSQIGVAELATDAETIAGTDTVRTIVPSALTAKLGVQTAEGIPFGQGTTSAISWTSALTDGQLAIGSTAGSPSAANLTGGTGVSITNAANSITIDASGSTPLSFPTDSGTATPAANVLTVSGGTGMATVGAGAVLTINLDTPVAISSGGTNATSFTQGSVLFMGAAAFSEDNSNLFWDDTNNRLGIGSTTPVHTLEVVGHVGIIQTATDIDQHAFEVTADAANFADFKAVDITYDTGSIAAGDFQAVILINVDETASTGGQNIALNVDTTTQGSATVIGLKTGIGINAIHQETGTFGNIDDILNIAVDVTAALASGGAGNISAFVLDTHTMTFGDATQWDELEVILTTPASGGGIAPTFEFSTGGTGFSSFGPIDGTNGFRNTGVIDWEASELSGWVANATGFFEIRITRTRNMLGTTPILDECQLSSETEHIWDSSGDVNINSLTLATDLSVANGGTGASTFTDHGALVGSGTSAITALAVGTDGQILLGSSAADPVFATATSSDSLLTLTLGAGSLDIVAQDAVAAAIALTDNAVVRGDGGSEGVQTSTMLISDAGEMTNPSQPAFLGSLGTSDTNVTGDGTYYDLGDTDIANTLTEIFDQNADFSPGASGGAVFTSPVDGRYSLTFNFFVIGATALTFADTVLDTSNRNYRSRYGWDAAAVVDDFSPGKTTLVDMDASDVAKVQIATIDTGGKIDDLFGSATEPWNYFSGFLAC